jgi:hypothetical protein
MVTKKMSTVSSSADVFFSFLFFLFNEKSINLAFSGFHM